MWDSHQSTHLGRLMMVLSVALILVATLAPRGSSFTEGLVEFNWDSFIVGWGRSGSLDILANIILFAPLGFSLANYLAQEKRLAWMPVLLVILLVSFTLSYCIEVLQVLLPSRFSSFVDVLSNTVGGLFGFLCFRLWLMKNVQITLAAYVTAAVFFSILLQKGTSFSNWDNDYYLFIGNEGTGDRPWRGDVSDLYLLDRALRESEINSSIVSAQGFSLFGKERLVANYQLTGRDGLHDSTGQLPILVWRDGGANISPKKTVMLGPDQWLATRTRPSVLAERLIQRSQFTLSVTAATADLTQTGPARIVSFSSDPNNRNFTLGQQGRDLVFRLRTPITGDGGVNPALIVPDVFSTHDPQNLTLTYDGAVLVLYVNGIRHPSVLDLTPGAAAGYFLKLHPFRAKLFKLLYYAFIFVPVGVLCVVAAEAMKRRFTFRVVLISAFIVLSAFLLEILLVAVSGKAVRLENLFLGVTWAMAGVSCYLLFRSCIGLQFSSQTTSGFSGSP